VKNLLAIFYITSGMINIFKEMKYEPFDYVSELFILGLQDIKSSENVSLINLMRIFRYIKLKKTTMVYLLRVVSSIISE